MILQATILGASVWGPGLEGWAASRPVLAGEAVYEPRPSPPPAPSVLPATERRRSGPVVRLALAAAAEAAALSGAALPMLRSVFASSNGDGPVVGAILEALATAGDERVVSPTQFHNSVHNAASGYWSIAIGSQAAATCIGCHDDSWAAGLLTAMAELEGSGGPVLLCAYDHPMPEPLLAVRPTGPAFAAALVLGAAQTGPQIRVQHDPLNAAPAPEMADPTLATLLRSNPAARALPILAALASARAADHALPYLEGRLLVEVRS